MNIWQSLPPTMQARGQQNSVAVHCDQCNNDFLWPKTAGDNVVCPVCANAAILDVNNSKPITPVIGD